MTQENPSHSDEIRGSLRASGDYEKDPPQDANLTVVRDGVTGKCHAYRLEDRVEKPCHNDTGGKWKEKEHRERSYHRDNRMMRHNERHHDEHRHAHTKKHARIVDEFTILFLPPFPSHPSFPSVDQRLKQLAKSPFTKEISSVTLPTGFMLVKFNHYDAFTDDKSSIYTSDQAIMTQRNP